MTKTIGLIVLLAAATSASPAMAQPEETVVVRVSRADLALSDKAFSHKIAMAVEQVCGSYASVEPYQWPEIDDCRRVAWAGARRQLAELQSSQAVKLGAR